MKIHYVGADWLVTACGTDTQVRPGTQVTSDTTQVTCLRCPKAKCYPTAVEIAQDAAHAAQIETTARVTDLYERAMCLGYTSDSAASVADCFTNWDHVSDPCPVHPNHSTTMRDGYLVDDCEACEIIVKSDAEDYYPGKWEAIVTAREAEYVKIVESHIAESYTLGQCACDLIAEMGAARLPLGGRVCQVCGSVFTPEGTEVSVEILAESGRIVDAKHDARVAGDQARRAAEAVECNADESLRASDL